ncbi:MAG: LemA family protein [Rhodospirillales bacterium]|nr:LemA family protein [Rhodospirillales bacterium]
MSNAKTNISAALLVIVPLVVIIGAFVILHNGLVSKEESVMGSWAQVESNYQRRADLIPNLVKTVQSFAEHERAVLSDVTEKRAGGTAVEQAIGDLLKSRDEAEKLAQGAESKLGDETYMKALATAQQQVGTRMGHLFGLVENYPQLRSSDNFLALQDQLEGTENRINVARMNFNENVRAYNAAIRKMPASLIAGMGGFTRKAYFKADDGTDKGVKVEF